jgi:hypothetical protein
MLPAHAVEGDERGHRHREQRERIGRGAILAALAGQKTCIVSRFDRNATTPRRQRNRENNRTVTGA